MRKLAWAALSFSAAVFLAVYLLPRTWLLWLVLGFGALGGLLILVRRKKLLALILVALGLAAGWLCCALHDQFRILPALRLDGQEVEIQAELLDYPVVYESYCRTEVRLTSQGLPHANVLLYAYNNTLYGAEPGDTIRCTVSFRRADQRYGERYDVYFSRNILLTANCKSEIALQESINKLSHWPVKLRHALTGTIDGIFPADTAAFMKSLMLGDKSDLYRDEGLHLAMTRAGCMHIAAVSGMHIAFLIGMIQLIFGKSRRSSVWCILLVWAFVLVTGASPSAVRAAIMQSFLLVAPMLGRENDPITSLSAALALILLFGPWSAASVSLQLSFGAMAGILCLAEPLQTSIESLLPERLARRLRTPISTVAGSLAVMVFTVPLMSIHFGSVQILSPLTNVLALWAVSLCFCAGYVSLLLALLYTPLGVAAAWLSSWLARYLFLVARLVSSIPFAVVYLKDWMPVAWLALVYALAGLAVWSDMAMWKKLLLPTLLAALSLALMNASVRQDYRGGDGTVAALDVGQGQCIAVMSGDRTAVIDCGGMFSLDNAGEVAGSYLRACGRDRIDLLVLTHLDTDHCNGVTMLMEMLPVETLVLPEAPDKPEDRREQILDRAAEKGTRVVTLSHDQLVTMDALQLLLFAPTDSGDLNARSIMVLASLGDYDMLVTGDASNAQELQLLEQHDLRDIELLIVGHHGSRSASSGELLGSIGADTAIVSVGHNSYGLPTDEVLQRLAAYGYTVYRTDLNGSVEIRLG